MIEYFGKSKVYNAKEASKKAEELYENIMMTDGGIVEYGICTIKYDAVFPGQIDLV